MKASVTGEGDPYDLAPICWRLSGGGRDDRSLVGAYADRVSKDGSASRDPELSSVKRAFDAAFLRMCEAASTDLLQDELSNMLHHMYRLGELRKRRWKANNPNFTETDFIKHTKKARGALGALWIRAYDTHEIAKVSKLSELYSNFYTEVYGVLAWQPIRAMPFIKVPNAIDRYEDYRMSLENKSVLDTLRVAFDALASLP